MKKTVWTLVATSCLLLTCQYLPAAVPPIPPEVKTHMLKFIMEMSKNTEAFYLASEKAGTPEAMAQAIDGYRQGVQPLIEGLLKLKAKYADFFKVADQSDQKSSGDAELDKANEAFEKRMEKLGLSMAKAVQWMEHPKVKAAMENMQKTMSLLDDPQKEKEEE